MHIQLTVAAWIGVGVGLACLGVLLARLLAWLTASSQRQLLVQRHTVIAEYDAPKLLSPAELGYIIDASFGTDELLATLASLYAKGAVTLQATARDDFTITVINDDTKRDVDDGEAMLLGYLRTMLRSQTTWGKLSSLVSDAAGPKADFQAAILQSLVTKRFLLENALTGVLLRKRLVAMIIATLGSLAVLMPVYHWGHVGIDSTNLAPGFAGIDRGVAVLVLIPLAVIVWLGWFMYANLLAYVYSQRDGVPTGATKDLRDLWPDVAGFQLFLEETEYVRLQHDPNPTDLAMPYCLALGLDPGFIASLSK